jgi:KUP system potassium uptake protein
MSSSAITPHQQRGPLSYAALACTGVVFGDIGTSALYTLQVAPQAASPNGAISPQPSSGSCR